jgi:putative RNA 2'-phosphotransferase
MNDTRLSKFMSTLLRHRAAEFGLTPDAEGFVPLAALQQILFERMDATPEDIQRIVEFGDRSKKRFEIRGGLIRARYGHSRDLGAEVEYPPAEPPEVLFHGTHPNALARIRAEGLMAMSRQYVHLSTTPARAHEVAARRTRRPVLLTIRAKLAHASGVIFHAPEPLHYLARAIPIEFIGFES